MKYNFYNKKKQPSKLGIRSISNVSSNSQLARLAVLSTKIYTIAMDRSDMSFARDLHNMCNIFLCSFLISMFSEIFCIVIN